MRTTSGPQRVSVLSLSEGQQVRIYRIVRSDSAEDPVLLNSLRSNYELGSEPRRVTRSWTVIHMGISAYLREESAHETADKFPKLGDFVAEIALKPGNGFNYAHTGPPWHLTVWADPVKLKGAVVDIVPVRE